jgi:hypothetical protein
MTVIHTRAIVEKDTRTVVACLRNGWLKFFSGPRPETPDEPPSAAARLLVALRFDNPAFEVGKDGVARATTLYSAPAVASGRATWFRTFTSGGTPVYDGSVVRSEDEDGLVLTEDIQAGQTVVLDDFFYQR